MAPENAADRASLPFLLTRIGASFRVGYIAGFTGETKKRR